MKKIVPLLLNSCTASFTFPLIVLLLCAMTLKFLSTHPSLQILCGLCCIDPIQMCGYILILVNVLLDVLLEVLDSLVVVLVVPSPLNHLLHVCLEPLEPPVGLVLGGLGCPLHVRQLHLDIVRGVFFLSHLQFSLLS